MDEEGEDVAGEQNETGDGAPAETGDILQDVELLDTSGWETYRNEEYGFEVKYPEGFNVTEGGFMPSDKGWGIIVQFENYVRDETSNENISIFENNEIQINFGAGGTLDCEKLEDCGTIVMIGDIPAARHVTLEGMHGPSAGYILFHNEERYGFGYLPANNASAPYAETIIHSLRFFK